jgi:hypothetical protein
MPVAIDGIVNIAAAIIRLTKKIVMPFENARNNPPKDIAIAAIIPGIPNIHPVSKVSSGANSAPFDVEAWAVEAARIKESDNNATGINRIAVKPAGENKNCLIFPLSRISGAETVNTFIKLPP